MMRKSGLMLSGNASVWGALVLLLLGLLSLSFGFYGFSTCRMESLQGQRSPYLALEILNNLYRAVSLFFPSEGNLKLTGNTCWPVQVSKFLAPLTTSLALFALVSKWLWEIWLHSTRRKRRIVICGLGASGRSLVRSHREERARIAVVERSPTEEDREFCRSHDAALYTGDAADPRVLQHAGLPRALTAVFICGPDETNIDAAVQAGSLIEGEREVEFHVRIRDLSLQHQLKDYERFSHPEQLRRVHLRPFSECDIAIRKLLAQKPLYRWADLRGQDRVHVVIFGLGCMGESLLRQVALICHYRDFEKPMVTAVDRHCSRREEEVLARYPQIQNACDVEFLDFDLSRQNLALGQPSLLEKVEARAGVTAAAFCLGCDGDNIGAGLTLREAMKRERRWLAPIFVRLKGQDAIKEFFSLEEKTHRFIDMIEPFGSLDEVCTYEEVFERRQDATAKAIHEAWLEREESAAQRRPSFKPWQMLDETYRESNRRAADHIPVKLASIGCIAPDTRILEFAPGLRFGQGEEVRLLSRLEHQRWCAERWIDGWRYGERDDGRKLHNNLMDFDGLEGDSQQFDIDHVLSLKKFLRQQPESDSRAGEPLIIRRELAIGVTGHRELTGEQESWVRNALEKKVFEEFLHDHYPEHSITLISPLAIGGDRIFVEAALATSLHGLRLIVPQPWPIDDMPDGLLQGVEWFIDLLPSGLPVSAVKGNEDLQRLQYQRVGAYLAERSDILVAIYDGKPERGPGGTGEVVRWRRDGNLIPSEASSLSSKQRKSRMNKRSWIHINPDPGNRGVHFHLD